MWTYRPQLDGLRTLAVYFVLIYHCGVGVLGGGFIGVDVFFVLSGFLVSNVILSEIDQNGRLSLSNFYARRVRRLLPAAVLMVMVTSLLYLVIAGYLQRLEVVSDARAALLYYANWHFLIESNDYFAQAQAPSPFLHFWSLSIEEQFYLGFPLLILLLARTGKSARNVALAIAVLFLLSLVAQIWWATIDINHAYYGTDARLYQLLAGALLALALRHRPDPLPARATGPVGCAGLAGLFVLASGQIAMSPSLRGILAVACSFLVIGAAVSFPDQWLGRQLGRRPIVYLGKISYGTYLWHWPVILVLAQLFGLGPLLLAPAAFVVATLVAALSFKLLEMPIRSSPRLFARRLPTVAGGLGISGAAAVLVAPLLLVTSYPLFLAGRQDFGPPVTTTQGRAQVPDDMDWRDVLEDRGFFHSCDANDPDDCVVVQGAGPHVLLIGDSHAGMAGEMFEELADDHDFTLSMNVVEGCGWFTGLVNVRVTKAVQDECYDAREEWYSQALEELDPDVVVLIQKARDDDKVWSRQLEYRDGRNTGLEEMLRSASLGTLADLAVRVPAVVVVHSILTPRPLRVQDCLAASRTVGECPVPIPDVRPPIDAAYTEADGEHDNVWSVDLNPVVCPGTGAEHPCLGFRDGHLVWRDVDHLSTDFTLDRREEFWRTLMASGGFRAFR